MYADLTWRLVADRQARLQRDLRRWNDRTNVRRGGTAHLAERTSRSVRSTTTD